METTEGASYGDGNLISVLDEASDGNLIVFRKLNSQLAAYMVNHYSDPDLRNALRRLIIEEITRTIPERLHRQQREDCEHHRDRQLCHPRRV